MFGYVLPDKPELKIKEYELFRAYYCGVCKSMGKRYGQFPRLTLNYDTTFLALLISSVNGECLDIKKERCIAHPLKKKYVVKNNVVVDYASDINIILAYYNLRDNWVDEKSYFSGTAMLALKKSFKKLKRKYSEKCAIIENRLAELSVLEEQKCNSMDRAAEPFAKLMEEITAYKPVFRNENDEKILRWIGYNLGKWIYIVDAFDDLEKDIKNGSYNPLVCQFLNSEEEVNTFKERIRQKVEFNLTYSLSQIAKSYEMLGLNEYKDRTVQNGIVDNIVYMGMLKKTEQILGIRSCGKSEKSI
ncbi:MAG: DUF5685 family protein [Clostridia bacterium]|nr:DUF5685 family protein [Clostridia bacterium]